MEENQTDLLTDIVSSSQLIRASTGKRFANFLIDYAVFFILLFCIGIIWAIVSPSTVNVLNDQNDTGVSLMDRLIFVILYVFYMSLIELVTKGRSLGKIITGTKAVNEDGSNIGAGTAFKRGLSRIVPFEMFSAFGTPSYPWHDKWNHTYVIDIKKSSQLSDLDQDHYTPSL